MEIKFLGHAAFLLTTADGTKIVIDPYHGQGPPVLRVGMSVVPTIHIEH